MISSSETLMEIIGSPLALAVRVTVLLAAAWCVEFALRRANPRWRILLWRATAMGIVAIVVIGALAPAMTWRVLPAAATTAVAPAEPIREKSSNVGHREQASRQPATFARPPSPAQRPSGDASPQASIPTMEATNPNDVDRTVRKANVADAAPVDSFNFLFWALAVWFGGVMAMLARLAVGVRRAGQIAASAVRAPASVVALAQELSHTWGMTGTIDVRQSDVAVAPCTLGVFRPVVLLPVEMCRQDSGSDVRGAVAHEVCHLAGRDLPWNAILEIVAAVWWFHPLVWRIRLAHVDACDERCDAIAAAVTADSDEYGRLLARVALAASEQPPAVALPMARSPRVLRRIALLSTGRGRARLGLGRAILAGLLLAVASMLLGTTAIDRRAAEAASPTDSDKVTTSDSVDTKPADAATPQLRGRIVDETGAPVTDATVSLTGAKRSGDNLLNHFNTKTDAEGEYAFSQINDEDTYRLRIESNRWVGLTNWRELPQLQLSPTTAVVHDVTLARACLVRIRTVDVNGEPISGVTIYPKNIAADHFSNVAGTGTGRDGWAEIGGLAPAETDYLFGASSSKFAFGKIQLRLAEPGQTVEETIVLETGVDVKGIALCSDGKPAAGWSINALPEWWALGTTPKGAEIGPAGEFTLPRIAPGKYNVTIGVPTGDGMTRVEPVMTGKSLPPSDGVLRVAINLPSPQSMGAISGKLLISGMVPQEGISIDAMNEDHRQHRGSARVGPGETNFRIHPLPPGRYRIDVTSTEIETVTLQNIEAPREGLEIPVEVRGKPQFFGRVVDDAGLAVSEFRVRVTKVGYLRGPNYIQESNWMNVSDPEGRFSVDLVGPGIYRATVAVDGWAPTTSEPINTDKPPAEPMVLKLSRGAILRGTVVDDEGRPIHGATVAPRSASPQVLPRQAKAFVGEERAVKTIAGKFELAGLPAGKELVRVTHPEYVFALSEEIALGNGDIELPPIVLHRGATVHGTVYDAAGMPRTNTTIVFHDASGYSGRFDEEAGRLATVVTDDAGRYEARHLPERLCYVHLAEEWDQSGVVRTAILPVQGKDQTLDFGGPGGIHGRLLVNGVPLANVLVQLGGENPHFGVFKAFSVTDVEGRFSFGRPPAGRRVLWYQPEGRRSNWIRVGEATFPASAPPGESFDLGNVDSQSGTVVFDVAGVAAAELASLRVRLLTIDPIWLSFGDDVGNPAIRERQDDPFTIHDVPPGEFEAAMVRSDGVMLRTPIKIKGGAELQAATLTWPASTGTLVVNIAADFCDEQQCSPPKLRSVDGRLLGYLQPKQDGEPLKIEGLPAGDYYLTNEDVRDARQVLSFAISSGQTTSIDVNASTFAPSPQSLGIVEIHWFAVDGVPLTGVEGSVDNAEDVEGLRITKRDAEWSIVGPPGDYFVAATFPGYSPKEIPVRIALPGPEGQITDDIVTECWLGD